MNEAVEDGAGTEGTVRRLAERLARVAQGIAAGIMIVMTAVIGWQVFGRFVLNDTPKWSEQVAGLAMIYLTLLGSAVLVWEDRHLALTFFRERLGARTGRFVDRLVLALILVFALVMIGYGLQMMELVRNWTMPTLGFSRSVKYWAFPAAGVLLAIFAVLRLARLGRG